MASVSLGFPATARAQDDSGPLSRAISATVDYGNDALFYPGKHNTDFDLLGLDPEQTVNVTVQFPVELVGQSIIAEPLDGGLLTLPEGGLLVSGDGMVSFQFQASPFTGVCRVAVHRPDDSNFLQFWIVDLEHPENNPRDLPGPY